MFRKERSNFIGYGQQRDPLLLIERDGKATEAIHRHAPLLADLEADGATPARLRRAFSALSRSSSACRLSSTLGGSSIQVIVRGVTPGRVTRLYPGRGGTTANQLAHWSDPAGAMGGPAVGGFVRRSGGCGHRNGIARRGPTQRLYAGQVRRPHQELPRCEGRLHSLPVSCRSRFPGSARATWRLSCCCRRTRRPKPRRRSGYSSRLATFYQLWPASRRCARICGRSLGTRCAGASGRRHPTARLGGRPLRVRVGVGTSHGEVARLMVAACFYREKRFCSRCSGWITSGQLFAGAFTAVETS